MSGKSNDTQALEQRNRELHNRSENMKEEVAVAKSRLKALKDLAAERAELAELKKYDPQRLRKNLDARRKSWLKTTAADKLQKSLLARSEQPARVKDQRAGSSAGTVAKLGNRRRRGRSRGGIIRQIADIKVGSLTAEATLP